jgi:hypothetical protein
MLSYNYIHHNTAKFGKQTKGTTFNVSEFNFTMYAIGLEIVWKLLVSAQVTRATQQAEVFCPINGTRCHVYYFIMFNVVFLYQ